MNFRSKIFIYSGIFALLGILLARELVHQYHYAEMGVNLLPIDLFGILLFSVAFLVFLVSALTAYVLIRRSKTALPFKKRFNFLIPGFVGWIILFLLLDRNYIELLVPVALILYGLILFNMNRFVTSRLLYFAAAMTLLGGVALFFPRAPWTFLVLGFAALPILFGLVLLKKSYFPST